MRVIARLLINHLNLQSIKNMELPTLKHVMDAYFSSSPLHTSSSFLIERKRRLSIMLGIVDELFGDAKDGLTWEEVYQRLGDGMDEKKFKQAFHPDFEIEADKLQLHKRAKHMVSNCYLPFGHTLSLSHLLWIVTSIRKHLECTNTEVFSSRQMITIQNYQSSSVH